MEYKIDIKTVIQNLAAVLNPSCDCIHKGSFISNDYKQNLYAFTEALHQISIALRIPELRGYVTKQFICTDPLSYFAIPEFELHNTDYVTVVWDKNSEIKEKVLW